MTPCEEEDLSIMKVKLPLFVIDVFSLWFLSLLISFKSDSIYNTWDLWNRLYGGL